MSANTELIFSARKMYFLFKHDEPLTYATPFCSVSIVDFEQVNISWVGFRDISHIIFALLYISSPKNNGGGVYFRNILKYEAHKFGLDELFDKYSSNILHFTTM